MELSQSGNPMKVLSLLKVDPKTFQPKEELMIALPLTNLGMLRGSANQAAKLIVKYRQNPGSLTMAETMVVESALELLNRTI